MLYFMKDESGNLVLVKNPVVGQKYFDSSGNEVVCQAPEASASQAAAAGAQAAGVTNVHLTTGMAAVEELAGLVRDMAQLHKATVGDLQQKAEEHERAIASYQQALRTGFPLPDIRGLQGASQEEKDHLWAPYDLAIQGKRLMEKVGRRAGAYRIENDAVREEMAKWFILFIKATVGRDQLALNELRYNPQWIPKHGDWAAKTALSSSAFPVPDIVMSEILGFAREKSIALQDARVWPMTSEVMSFPAESTNPTLAWGATTSESTPVSTEVELTALELSAYSAIRNPLLADARSDIVSWLTELMAEAQGLELDNCMFNGDGTSPSASCSGILSAAAGYSVVFGSGSTNFSEIGASHLSEMISKLDGLKKVGAKFRMNGAVFHYVRNLVDSQNRPIFIQTIGDVMSSTIWGYPYQEAIKCPGTSAAATGFISFANLLYFAVGRRLDVTTLEANPWGDTAWAGNQTWFKLYNRWALKIALANAFVRMVTAAS